MNLKEVKEMIELMNENGLTELELERDGTVIKLKKSVEQGSVAYTIPAIPAVSARPAVALAAPAAEPVAVVSNLIDVKSPMVGTFYRAQSPEAAPFVEIGQAVEVGQVVCIVEAMKLMNEIKSETAGTVVEILVQNGQTVEYDQPILKIKKV